jgi:lysyl-tRNA synthetase class 1
MIWVDREVKKIIERNLKLEWVDDMKTPSGPIHVGSLRGVVIHDLIYKVLLENGKDVKFTWIFDDQDPMDGMPSFLNFDEWEKYMGMQLYKIPSPEPGYESYAKYYALKFQEVFESINCHPEIIWGSELYNSGKMNGVIKEALDNAAEIRKIYLEMYKKPKADTWYPFNAVCEKCQKVGTTQVYKWDGEYVYYKCEPEKVAWAKGCGHQGKTSPFDGKGKLPWKIEWPAKWKALGITVEGAGKDHMSHGGSHDLAEQICKRVLHYEVPYPIPYEFFIAGGKKMSSSKGIGTSAQEISSILPPELTRFLIVRTPINSTIDFNPFGDTIPNLFDEYDKCLSAYYDKKENILEKGKVGEVKEDLARIIELSEVRPFFETRIFVPRFRTVVSLVKTKADILKFFETQKGSTLTEEEKEILEERVVYAQVYLKDYAEEEEKLLFLETLPSAISLNDNQKKFLVKLADSLETQSKAGRDEIQTIVFNTLKSESFQAREVFKAFYQVLIGRDAGPKAADIILEFGIDRIVKRLKEVAK